MVWFSRRPASVTEHDCTVPLVFAGNRHGFGHLLYEDGSEYQGAWKFDKPHGRGTLVQVRVFAVEIRMIYRCNQP